MFSLTWSDGRRDYVVVGDGYAILAMFNMIIRNPFWRHVQVRECRSGLQLDPFQIPNIVPS